jgi:two-component system nitrate/nitrite response regulator NarL
MRATLLIVDDHAGFRRLARRLLRAEGFRVVGEAEHGWAALAAAARLRPDVVLLDVLLSDIDGFEVAKRLAEGPVQPRVVLTSSRCAADVGDRVEASPAAGFLHKDDLSGGALASLAGITR